MSSLDWVRGELAAWEDAGLLRAPHVIATASAPEVELADGRRVVLLCSNNYLGLADDPRVRAAAAAAVNRWGAGAGASRLVSGTTSAHRDLELELARFEGTEDAVLFSSGYLANVGVLTTITGPADVVFSDELNHASIVDGCRLSRARTQIYRHRDVQHLDELLAATEARRRVVVTDTVFSMDGDLAPLDELTGVCGRHDAILVVDEAHATGVLGPHGAGATDELGVTADVPVIVGTLSKALGSTGGYVATTAELAALLRNRARTHVFDTAPAPSTIAAARAALRIAATDSARRDRVRRLARDVASALRELGFDAGEPAAAVIPVLVGDARDAVALSERLLERGVFCPAIRPPSVPEGTSRLRVTVMATHTDEHIERVLEAFGRTPTRRAQPARRDVFVTGTDTGVGKTIVTAAIARTLANAGLRVAIFKPLQTGAIDGDDDARDAAELSGCDAFTGIALADPLAPSVAAELAGVDIDVAAIVQRYRDLARGYDAVIVEGAGGLLVPIDDDTTMADLARAIGAAVVVVARPALGTLNHTALTIESARAHGLDVAGIVISGMPDEPTLAERTNPGALERLCDTSIVGVVPRLRDVGDAFDGCAAWLSQRFGGTFDRERFLEGQRSPASLT